MSEAEQSGPERVPGVYDELARLPAQAMVDEKTLAAALGVTGRTVRRMVARLELPPAIQVAGRSVWFAGRVLAWLEAQAERNEQDAQRQQKRIQEACA